MRIRVLCLGNDLLADDALGPEVAAGLRRALPRDVEVVSSGVSGMWLLDEVVDATHLLVVDTVRTDGGTPGAVRRLREEDFGGASPGGSPHYVGLFDVLRLGRSLGLAVPSEVTILAVEAADVLTVGGGMHPEVRAAIPAVLGSACEVVGAWRS